MAICFDQLVTLFAPELADKVQRNKERDREEEKREKEILSLCCRARERVDGIDPGKCRENLRVVTL